MKRTIDSGVCVKDSTNGEDENDHYGIVNDVIELVYPSSNAKKVIVFEREWFDPTINKGIRVTKLQYCRGSSH